MNAESPTKPVANAQSTNLDNPGMTKAVAKRIAEDIAEFNIREYDDGHRNHLGGSLIGDECKRKLWYSFRWCFREGTGQKPDEWARKLRLFNRGHREEDRFIGWLKGIGAQVWTHERNPVYDQNGVMIDKGEQFRVSAVMGHFGGSLDGIARLPARYGIDEPILLEFKTNGTGVGFNKVFNEGMAVAKPQHFAQTSTYGSDPQYKLRYCGYFVANKNDDSLAIEVVKLDWKLGDQMRAKAEQIILSQIPPPRISDNPTYRGCGWCAAKAICHQGAIPEKNCRSCVKAHPVDNKEWFCETHNGIIPKEFIKEGCDAYIPITATTQR